MRGVLAGCGFFAQFQMDAWRRMTPEVEITAVCDLDELRAQFFQDRYGIPRRYNDFEVMLKQEAPDFADIVTRPEAHLAMVRQAAHHGVAVLCQKPLAPTMAAAREIIDTARGIRLMVNENWRWQAWYREIKTLLDGGTIGEPFSYRWIHRANDGLLAVPYPNQPYFATYPRFLIYETLVHYLDAGRFLFGEADRVACEISRVNPAIAGEDLVLILLGYPGRLRGIIDANRCSPLDAPGDAMGNLRIDGTGGTLWLAEDGAIHVEPRNGVRYRQEWCIPVTGYRGDSCFLTQRHFVDCLRSGTEFETSGVDYLRTLELVEACYESAARGQSVAIGR